MTHELRGYDLWLTNQPLAEIPDEACDGCTREIGNDFAIRRSDGSLYCEDCAVRVERCSDCGYLRCRCDDD